MATPLWAERRFGSTCVVKGCGALIPKGKRKCARHLKVKKRTQGKAVTKGANARGTCLHKPDKPRTKKPKGQQTGGSPPKVSKTRWA